MHTHIVAQTHEPADIVIDIPLSLLNYDGNKCTDEKNDCCASPTWGEPQTCKDGYVARPITPKECPNKGCAIYDEGIGCYGCYPPTIGGRCEWLHTDTRALMDISSQS